MKIPTFLQKIWQGWKKIAKAIGRVNSVIILTIFYFLIVGPVAIIKKTIKLFQKEKSVETFWQNYRDFSDQDYTKQF